MKNTLIILLTIFISINCYAQITVEDIISEYSKNPQRATDRYLNKAIVTIKVQIQGIYYSTSSNPLWNNIITLNCSRDVNNGISIHGVKYSDAIKLNNHDSIIVRGLLSGRGSEVNSKHWDGKDILLKNSQLVQIVNSDYKFKDDITSRYLCNNCKSDIKKYQEYIVEDIMNSVRSMKTCLNKSLILNVVIKDFHKNNIINYIGKGGIGGYVVDGEIEHRIVFYGINPKEYNRLNVGDTIKIKGNLAQTKWGRAAVTEFTDYELITLNKCVLIK